MSADPMMYDPMQLEQPEPEQNDELTEDDLQSIISQEIENAINFIESDIAPQRVTATEYYRGMLFGDEQEGRSQFISRDVHDTVNSIIPSLMRIFFGPEHVVEFVPTGPDDVDTADQATDYVSYIFTKDNPGFLILHSLVKDSLIRKCGIAKCDWDSRVEVTVQDYTGLDIMAMLKLEQDFNQQGAQVEIIAGQMKPDGTADVRIKIKRSRDRVRIDALPVEEFFIDADARGLGPNEFRTCGHGRELPISQLVAMGYDKEQLDDARGETDFRFNLERQARSPIGTAPSAFGEPADESQENIFYAEAYTYVDADRDGIAELHKFCCAGTAYKVLHHEIVDDHPFAEFPCDPEPHTFFGTCTAEKAMDIQKTKSGIVRASLDSLALSIFPRTVIKKSGVEIEDVLNTEVGAVIRTDDVNNIRTDVVPFVGEQAFPMLAYMDEVRENRTGMSKVSMGLNPEALQNTTAMAAAAQFDKAHEQIEIIARIFAETGFKRLFRRILKLTAQNQREARVVSLRGRWVPVDPRAWKTDMEVTANVAVGAGSQREKVAALTQILGKQEQIMAIGGMNNPMVSLNEYHNTFSRLLPMIGFKNVNAFFKDPSQAPPMPPQQPPPDPKAQNDAQKLNLDFIKHQNDMAQKSADRDQETMLKLYEINAKYHQAMDVAGIKAAAEAMRVKADLTIQRSESRHG